MFKTIHECGLQLIASSNCDDVMPVRAARASFGKQDKTGENPEDDIRLMHYLADHQHMTPFEYQHATFLIECPLFIRSQIHRHRTFAYNEISRRYTSENIEFWIPDTFRGQAKNNKQASEGVLDAANFIDWLGWTKNDEGIPVPEGTQNGNNGFTQWKWSCYNSWHTYLALLESGVAREQARAVLPQALLTRFYMGGTLRNWQHFIGLRRHNHAQYEVQVIANRVADELRKLWPESCNALGI